MGRTIALTTTPQRTPIFELILDNFVTKVTLGFEGFTYENLVQMV
ncbi:MAG: hypothetical protein WA183_13235 [Chthoniobacterales bacterium]